MPQSRSASADARADGQLAERDHPDQQCDRVEYRGIDAERVQLLLRDTAHAMSQEDVDTLRSAYETINRGDWGALFRDAQPDFELKTPDRMMRHGTFRGAETIRQVMEDLLEPFEDVVAEPEEFFDSGDRIVVFVSLRSRPKDSSAAMEIRIAHLWTMRDGKAAQLEIFPEREKALAAAGLNV